MNKEVQQAVAVKLGEELAFYRLLTIVEAETTGLTILPEYAKKLDRVMEGTAANLTREQIELINDIFEHNSELLMKWLRARHEENRPRPLGGRSYY